MIIPIVVGLTAAILFGVTTWHAFQQRDRPTGQSFVALLGAETAWVLLLLGAQITTALSAQSVTESLEFATLVPAFIIPGIWTIYALSYAGRETGLTRNRILMLAGLTLPVILVGGIFSVVAIDPPRVIGGSLIAALLLLLLLSSIYPLLLLVYGAVVLVRLGQKHETLSNSQILLLLLAISAPYLGIVAEWGDLSGTGVSVGLLVAGGLFSAIVRWHPVFSRFPESESVARTRVVESLQEAVVVLNWEGYVLDVNEAAVNLLGRSADELNENPITSVIEGIDDADLSAGATGLVTLRTTSGRRQFQYSVSAVDAVDQIGSDDGSTLSRAVVLRDVTDEQIQQQRLKVLNRILRHNVRNRLDVVLAHANQIEAETPRSQVRKNASDLIELSERAREAEEIMQVGTDPPESIDLVTIAEEIIDEYPPADSGAEITLASPDELPIKTHPAIVRQLLSELIDNAIKHTEQSTPRVSIRIDKADGAGAKLVVADNGPGIPQQEQEVLTAETETPLKHSQGVGLWFVKWAVTQLGGDLIIEENDPRGSIVTACIRDAVVDYH